MSQEFFKFTSGKIQQFDPTTSSGVIAPTNEPQSGSVFFFLSDFSRVSNTNPVGQMVFFSQVEKKSDNQNWAAVVVEDTHLKQAK